MTAPLWEHRCCTTARLSPQRTCPRCYAIADTYAWAVPTENELRLRATPDGPLVSIAGPVLAPDTLRPAPVAPARSVVVTAAQTTPVPPQPTALRRLAAPMQPPARAATTPVRPPGARPHRPHEDDDDSGTHGMSKTSAGPESPVQSAFGTVMVLMAAGLIVAGVTSPSAETSAVLTSLAAILMVVFLPLVTGRPPHRPGTSSARRP